MKLVQQTTRARTDLPVFTFILGSLALLLHAAGESVFFLEYDRSALAAGELWRWVTGHWIHWSFDHFLWCLVAFTALGCICESISRKGFLATLALASLFIPAISWVFEPGMHTYRGLSGLASALYVFGTMMMIHKANTEKDHVQLALFTAAALGYLGKSSLTLPPGPPSS